MPSECIDGRWRFTGYDDLQQVLGRPRVRDCDGVVEFPQRPVFLPLYKFWNRPPDPYSIITDQPYEHWGNRYEGRVVVDPGEVVPPEYMTNLGPTDVVHWPLYEGTAAPQNRGFGTGQKLPAYKENVAKLKDIGPGLRGVLVGNCGCELAIDHWLQYFPTYKERQEQRLRGLQFLLDFIHETGDLLAGMGVQSVWAPMDRHLLMDYCHWDGRMAEAIASYGGWMIVFQEGALFPRWTCIFGNEGQDGIHLDPSLPKGHTAFGEEVDHNHHHEPGYTDWEARCVEWDVREVYPYRRLLEYFRKYPVWHCIGYAAHFRAGFDNLLLKHGCRAVIY